MVPAALLSVCLKDYRVIVTGQLGHTAGQPDGVPVHHLQFQCSTRGPPAVLGIHQPSLCLLLSLPVCLAHSSPGHPVMVLPQHFSPSQNASPLERSSTSSLTRQPSTCNPHRSNLQPLSHPSKLERHFSYLCSYFLSPGIILHPTTYFIPIHHSHLSPT